MRRLNDGSQDGPPEPTRQPWEPWEGESHKAFEAFSLYLNMGTTRSAQRVADLLGKSATMIHRWSSRWNWKHRAQAYDNDQARLMRDGTARALSRQAALYTQISTHRLGNMTPAERDALSPHEIALFSKMAFELSGGTNAGNGNGFPEGLPMPKFEIVVLKLEPTQVFAVIDAGDMLDGEGSVLRSDGEIVKFGAESIHPDGAIRMHIGRDFIDRFRADFPTATVLV